MALLPIVSFILLYLFASERPIFTQLHPVSESTAVKLQPPSLSLRLLTLSASHFSLLQWLVMLARISRNLRAAPLFAANCSLNEAFSVRLAKTAIYILMLIWSNHSQILPAPFHFSALAFATGYSYFKLFTLPVCRASTGFMVEAIAMPVPYLTCFWLAIREYRRWAVIDAQNRLGSQEVMISRGRKKVL